MPAVKPSNRPELRSFVRDHSSRRQFLQLAAVLSVAAACQTTDSAETAALPAGFATVGGGRKVLVLGAGIAGLAAAFELQRAGFVVQVLERQARVGGRILTLRDAFEGGQYAELGATRIPSHHLLTRGYCTRFGLELVALPDPVLTSPYAQMAFPDLGDPRLPGWPDAAMRKYDEMSFAQYLRGKGASEAEIAALRLTESAAIDHVSALAFLGAAVLDAAQDGMSRVAGGNDQLAERFAAELGERVTRGVRVRRVESDAEGVRVSFETAEGKVETARGDFVVCTLAPSVLKDLEWAPGPGFLKAEAMSAATMQPVTCVNLQFQARSWPRVTRTGLAVESLWDMTVGQAGERGILGAMVRGDVPAAGRQEWALAQAETVFPGIAAAFVKGHDWAWQEQDWVKGGWYVLKPGQFDQYLALRRPEGRLHFAGDHTTLPSGWIESALDSAHRVVGEISRVKAWVNKAG